MKRNIISVTAGMATAGLIAAVAAVVLPGAANAGDWNNGAGSIKDYGRPAVPVPAPIPVPDYSAKWYLRADAGYGWMKAPDVGEDGYRFGATNSPGATGPTPFGTSAAWFSRDFETSASWGVGAGYYWSSRFRTDFTADVKSHQEIKSNAGFNYQYYGRNAVTQAWAPVANTTVYGTLVEKTTIKTGLVLFNAYFDMARYHGLTPYIGVGLGLAVNELERHSGYTERACDATGANCGQLNFNNGGTGSAKVHTTSLAWALMAGASYELAKATKVDLNYRFVHMGGTHVELPIQNSTSRLSYGAHHEHQLRAGLRFDIE